jgi:hypothetical protein
VSEFGSGVVVCLAKFSEHMMDWRAKQVYDTIEWMKMSPAEKQYEIRYAANRGNQHAAKIVEAGDNDSLSQMIWLWMNAAADHLRHLDEAHAPAPLSELRAFTLHIGHDMQMEGWDAATVERIRDLWKESCLAVDRMLGVENGDWGQW